MNHVVLWPPANCIEVSPGLTRKSKSENFKIVPVEVVVPPRGRLLSHLVGNFLVASNFACVPKHHTEPENTCTLA